VYVLMNFKKHSDAVTGLDPSRRPHGSAAGGHLPCATRWNVPRSRSRARGSRESDGVDTAW